MIENRSPSDLVEPIDKAYKRLLDMEGISTSENETLSNKVIELNTYLNKYDIPQPQNPSSISDFKKRYLKYYDVIKNKTKLLIHREDLTNI